MNTETATTTKGARAVTTNKNNPPAIGPGDIDVEELFSEHQALLSENEVLLLELDELRKNEERLISIIEANEQKCKLLEEEKQSVVQQCATLERQLQSMQQQEEQWAQERQVLDDKIATLSEDVAVQRESYDRLQEATKKFRQSLSRGDEYIDATFPTLTSSVNKMIHFVQTSSTFTTPLNNNSNNSYTELLESFTAMEMPQLRQQRQQDIETNYEVQLVRPANRVKTVCDKLLTNPDPNHPLRVLGATINHLLPAYLHVVVMLEKVALESLKKGYSFGGDGNTKNNASVSPSKPVRAGGSLKIWNK